MALLFSTAQRLAVVPLPPHQTPVARAVAASPPAIRVWLLSMTGWQLPSARTADTDAPAAPSAAMVSLSTIHGAASPHGSSQTPCDWLVPPEARMVLPRTTVPADEPDTRTPARSVAAPPQMALRSTMAPGESFKKT